MAFSLTKKVALLSSIRHILSSRQHDLIFLRASPSAPAPVSERTLPGSRKLRMDFYENLIKKKERCFLQLCKLLRR
jgi:hypothetical protein